MTNSHPAEDAYFSEVAAHKGWHIAADEAIAHLIKKGSPFSADDIRDLVKEEPSKPGAWGGLFLSWKRRGLIVRAGQAPSRQQKNNHREQKLWVGITHKDAA